MSPLPERSTLPALELLTSGLVVLVFPDLEVLMSPLPERSTLPALELFTSLLPERSMFPDLEPPLSPALEDPLTPDLGLYILILLFVILVLPGLSEREIL